MAKLGFIKDFKKAVAKLDTVDVGIKNTEQWLSTGNYALNRALSGNFERGIPLGKITLFAGPSGCLPADSGVYAYVFNTKSEKHVAQIEYEPVGGFDTNSQIPLLEFDEDFLREELEYHAVYVGSDLGVMDVETAANIVMFKCAELMLMSDVETAIRQGNVIAVQTPTGFKRVSKFFVKQPREIVQIVTVNGLYSLNCSADHAVEVSTGEYKFAGTLTTNDWVCTMYDGFQRIESCTSLNVRETVYDFELACPNHEYWAQGIKSHNSGKSFIASNVALQAQRAGYHVVYLDSENAIDTEYLRKIGVKIDEDNLTYVSVTTIEDVNNVLSEFFQGYRKEVGKDWDNSVQKTLIVLDSLAMLNSATEMENYDKSGIIKADQGLLAKRRKAMLRLATGHLKSLPVAMVVTDHVYPQDIMMGDGAWAITNSTKFSSSIIGIVTKLKLKEDSVVTGVRMRFETYKSRYAVLGTKVELEVPYNKGMTSTTGLLDILLEMGIISKGTNPGEKTSFVAEIVDADTGEITDRIVFKERDFNDDIARRLLKHPKCVPITIREDELVIEDIEDSDE